MVGYFSELHRVPADPTGPLAPRVPPTMVKSVGCSDPTKPKNRDAMSVTPTRVPSWVLLIPAVVAMLIADVIHPAYLPWLPLELVLFALWIALSKSLFAERTGIPKFLHGLANSKDGELRTGYAFAVAGLCFFIAAIGSKPAAADFMLALGGFSCWVGIKTLRRHHKAAK
jgi:hypothetical protein